LPNSMDEALWYEMPQSELQFRSGGSGTDYFMAMDRETNYAKRPLVVTSNT